MMLSGAVNIGVAHAEAGIQQETANDLEEMADAKFYEAHQELKSGFTACRRDLTSECEETDPQGYRGTR